MLVGPDDDDAEAVGAEREGGVLQSRWRALTDEMDNVIDDFLNNRLGRGHIYYGKRKSGFYREVPGSEGRKSDARARSADEDYKGGGWTDIRRMARRVPGFRPPGQPVEDVSAAEGGE